MTEKTYEQVIQTLRGVAEAPVTLGIKDGGGVRKLSITRVGGEPLYKNQKSKTGSHGNPAR
ncbi:MAG: hypothetical protein CAF45_012945 [Nitrospira sp. CG24E]|nr:MAG: hypothetical protein CAF45_012945 [Nitrospira sp. CG24E]